MLNKVQIIGRLGRDPETRNFQNGGKVVNLAVATSETWKSKDGERKERTEWHNVSVHAEHAANFAQQYLRKGAMVYIEGKLETRKWQDQSGQDRYTTEVTIRPFSGELQSLSAAPGSSDRRAETPAATTQKSQQAQGASVTQELDDEIPF